MGRANEKSAALPLALQQACNTAGLRMVDGNEFGRSSERDPIHWGEETVSGSGPCSGPPALSEVMTGSR